jgi:hypothetical protein
MVAPICFGITVSSSGNVPSAFCEMLNWGAVDRICMFLDYGGLVHGIPLARWHGVVLLLSFEGLMMVESPKLVA